MIEALRKLGIQRMYLNLVKVIYNKPIGNILLNGRKLKEFLLMSGIRKVFALSLLSFNILLEFLARVI
jgi:hypothetical protein